MADYKTPQWLLPNEKNLAYPAPGDGITGSGLSEDRHSLYSMDFDGTSYIDTGISTLTGTDFSISYWFKTTATLSAFNYYVPFSAVTNYQFTGAYLYFLGTLTVGSRNSTGTFVRGTTDLSDGNWHHIIVTYDISSYSLKMYVDGSIEYDETIGSINNFNQPLLLGGKSSSQYLIDCSIDEAAYWNKVLSQSEIDALSVANAPANLMALNEKPYAYYPLGEQAQMGSANWSFPNGSLQSHVIDFDAADYISTSHISLSSAFSVSAWVNTTDTNTYGNIFSSDEVPVGGSVRNWQFIRWNNKARFILRNSSGSSIVDINTSSKTINDGIWHNIVATWDGTTGTNGVKIYVDNVLEAQGTASSTALANSAIPMVMSGSSATWDFIGKISNVAIWNSDQSTNIDNIYNNGSPQSTYTATPTAWWKLNAANSSYDTATSTWTFTDGPGTNDGTSTTLPASALTPSDLQFESPYSNYSLSFDGVSDFISIPDSAELKPTTAITCSIWFKGGTQNSNRHLLSKYFDTVDGAYGFYTGSSSTDLYFYITVSGTTYDSSVVSGKLDNNWHHILGTYDGANIKVYADGALVGSVARTGLIDYNDGILCLSSLAGAPTSYEFEGLLDEAAIWNTALTASQANQIYNNGYPNDLTSLSPTAWWRLGEDAYFVGNDITIPNKITSGQTGTGSGTQSAILVGNAPGSYANGSGTNLAVEDRIGDAPESTANSVSKNMIPSNRISYPAGYVPTQVDNVYSMEFDGLNDTINCGNITALNGLSGGSWSFWLNVNDDTTQGLFNQWGTGTDRLIYSFIILSSGRIDIYFSPGNGAYRVTSNPVISALNPGEWFNLVIVFDGTIGTLTQRLRVYINGELLTGNIFNGPTSMQSSTSDFIIGTYPSGTYFDGKMDEVAIFNYALSERQIKQDIYGGTTPGGKTADLNNISNLTAPVAWYRMGD